MIRVSLPMLVFIYLAMLLATVFAAWIVHEWRRQRRERLAFRHVIRCGICMCEFEDKTGAELPRCPTCGSLNERRRFSRL